MESQRNKTLDHLKTGRQTQTARYMMYRKQPCVTPLPVPVRSDVSGRYSGAVAAGGPDRSHRTWGCAGELCLKYGLHCRYLERTRLGSVSFVDWDR